MSSFSRRDFLSIGGGAAAMSILPGLSLLDAAAKEAVLKQLIFSGPPAPPSIYLAHLAQQEGMKAHAEATHFLQWRSPDMLISQVLNGQTHVSATPSNVAAMLYNKGAKIKLLDITTWGVLHLLTRRNDIKKFTDLKGKNLQLFFRGGMPDITIQYLAIKLGLKPGTDIKMSYSSNPLQLMKLFMLGKIDTVILPEPAVTAAKLGSKMAGMPIHSIDIQKVWEEVTGRSRIPQAGTLIHTDLIDKNPELVSMIKVGIKNSVNWMNEKPAEAAKLGSEQFGLPAQIITKAMKNVKMEYVSAVDAREELEFFYTALMELSPKLVGGKLPDDGFYLG